MCDVVAIKMAMSHANLRDASIACCYSYGHMILSEFKKRLWRLVDFRSLSNYLKVTYW